MLWLALEENQAKTVDKSSKWPNERKLLQAAQNGSQEAFGVLVRNHQKRLFRFVYAILRNFDSAEDIVQESFVKAWQALKTFRPGHDFYPWLSTIARNLAYNWIRREEKKESLDKLRESGFDPESTDLGPFEKLLSDESSKRLYKAVMALPSEYRRVFVLRQFEEMSYDQIASYLKIPPGTVDSRLYRARKLLMESLKDLLE